MLFTGEMIYPWMFDTDPALRPFRAAAHVLAERAAWPALYDVDRLRATTVPVAAAIYEDDMYLDRDLSVATARTIRGLRPWITGDHRHDGLRTSDGAVLDRLIGLLRAPPEGRRVGAVQPRPADGRRGAPAIPGPGPMMAT